MDSVDSDVFFVEQLSNEPSPQRNNSPHMLNSTQASETHAREMPTFPSVASPKPDIVTLDDGSNESTIPYQFGRQLPIITPSLNDLNLPPNPFNIQATMAPVNTTGDGHDENYSPQSREQSDPSPISTPPMILNTIDGWETPQTTTDDNTFYLDDEPRRIHWTTLLDETFYWEGEPRRIYLLSSPSPPSPPRKMKRKLEMGMSFQKRRRVSQHVCEAGGLMIPSIKDIPGPSTKA